ncbi:hypothetical protein MSPGM_38470 [Methylorubrum sp. GM97]|nr:hypothetical protein MSPGM_38470 [Methylorubrum sp. GM97]
MEVTLRPALAPLARWTPLEIGRTLAGRPAPLGRCGLPGLTAAGTGIARGCAATELVPARPLVAGAVLARSLAARPVIARPILAWPILARPVFARPVAGRGPLLLVAEADPAMRLGCGLLGRGLKPLHQHPALAGRLDRADPLAAALGRRRAGGLGVHAPARHLRGARPRLLVGAPHGRGWGTRGRACPGAGGGRAGGIARRTAGRAAA